MYSDINEKLLNVDYRLENENSSLDILTPTLYVKNPNIINSCVFFLVS